jgi:hypothetical protein
MTPPSYDRQTPIRQELLVGLTFPVSRRRERFVIASA